MREILAILIVLMIIITTLSGCTDKTNQENEEDEQTFQNGDIRKVSTESIDGKYNVSLLQKQSYYDGKWYNFTEIEYTKDGETYTGSYRSEMEDLLNWIKKNTSENCTILCWWDYGHMVEGYAERNALATYASINLIDTIADFNNLEEDERNKKIQEIDYWTPNEILEDIAYFFTSFSINNTKDLLEKYNVSYILTHHYDRDIAPIFFRYFGKNNTEYLVNNSLTEKAKQTTIFQLWADNYVPTGLELIYNPGPARLFKIN